MMSLSWNEIRNPFEGVTGQQLEALFGAPVLLALEAGSHCSLTADAPRTAYLVVSGALHGGGQEVRLMPELAVPRGEVAGLGRLVLADASEQTFAVGEGTVIVALDGRRLEERCLIGDPDALAMFDGVVLLLSVDLRASNEALQTLIQS